MNATIPTQASAAAELAQYAGKIETPFGAQFVKRGEAIDHAHMRSRQLSSLLLLIQANDAEGFRGLGVKAQDNLLWMAVQLADEVHDTIAIIENENLGGAA